VKALVTGAAGFIGSHVVRQLCEAGHEVRALHLATDDLRNLRGLDVERIEGDVTDRDSMARATRGVEVVFHLAAIFAIWTTDGGRRMRSVNVDGTRLVLESARAAGCRRVVHTSSIARFGGQGMHVRATEESPFALGPTGDRYSASKAEAHEVAALAASEQDVVIVAPCGPIGPGDIGPTPTGRIMIRSLELPFLFAARSMTNFVDVRDVAHAHLLAAERGVRGETYLLGHRDLWMREVVQMALDATGQKKPILEAPFPIASAVGAMARAWADRVTRRPPVFTPEAVRIARLGLRADCAKAVRELGMRQTPIETAVADAVAWFEREGMLRVKRSI
jgi:dihydroflavonol-4-reductase